MIASPMAYVPDDFEEAASKALAPIPSMALSAHGETASAAAAVQAKTQVEARYMVAVHRPRSVMQFRSKLLDACKRPRFAQTARYAKPVGKEKVVGWSVRFAEECARCLGNLLVESAVIYDDPAIRIVRVMVTDLEANLTYPTDVTVAKTVERRFLKKGQAAIRTRINSFGEPVHIVDATDDDILNKQNALVSKAIRTGVLRVVPGDILEEAEELVLQTVHKEDAQDPAFKAKQIADAFYAHGVMPDRIEKVLGHPLAQVSPAEVNMMRTWITAIKDGDTTWRQIEEAVADLANDGATASAPSAPSAAGSAGLRDRLAKKATADAADAMPRDLSALELVTSGRSTL